MQHVASLAACLVLIITVGILRATAAGRVEAVQAGPTQLSATTTPSAASGVEPEVATPSPDVIADHVGGAAARLRRADGTSVPGEIYLLMATLGSHERARLFEQTPFTHDHGAHVDTIDSNRRAAVTAQAITGRDVELNDFTSAPGGGPSGGLAYLIAYLNIISDGAFTANVSIAATGELQDEGYIAMVSAPNEKLGAARLSVADVFFTPTDPSHAALAEHAERHVGQQFHSRYGRATLAVERQLDEYESWGASDPDGLDVVSVGHIADVASYLCGAGADYACSIAADLGATITSDTLTEYDLVRMADRSTNDLPIGSPLSGSAS